MQKRELREELAEVREEAGQKLAAVREEAEHRLSEAREETGKKLADMEVRLQEHRTSAQRAQQLQAAAAEEQSKQVRGALSRP